VILGRLLANWVVHDLDPVGQIAAVVAGDNAIEVGPRRTHHEGLTAPIPDRGVSSPYPRHSTPRQAPMTTSTDHARIIVNPFLIYGAAFLLAVLAQRIVPLPFLPPSSARLVGLLVFLAGFAFGLPAARAMRAARTTFNPQRSTTALVVEGVFRRSRNPIYVALLLNYAGLCIFFGTLWGLFLVPLVIWLTDRWVIIPEEAYLRTKFGDSYDVYASSVRRWL
jgi:protein-S-isoprenylcysteine O-methyltransferase Ste14